MIYTFETWVSYPARAVNADDGLRIEFTVPVHSDLQAAMKNPEKREILCKYRVRKGFLWGQLGRNARVKIEATVIDGARGGQHLHCSAVDILEGKPRTPKADPAARRMEKKLARQAGVTMAELRPAKPEKTKATAPAKTSPSTPQLSIF